MLGLVSLLLLDSLDSALEVVALKQRHVSRRDEERSLGEEESHLLKRTPGGLGEEGPEEQGVGEVAHLQTKRVSKPGPGQRGARAMDLQ